MSVDTCLMEADEGRLEEKKGDEIIMSKSSLFAKKVVCVSLHVCVCLRERRHSSTEYLGSQRDHSVCPFAFVCPSACTWLPV